MWLSRAWDDVTAVTILNCFKKAGITSRTAELIEEDEEENLDLLTLQKLLKSSPVSVEDYSSIDSALTTEDAS